MRAFFAPAKKKTRTQTAEEEGGKEVQTQMQAEAKTQSKPGLVRVGRRIYGPNGTLDSKLPGFKTILCLTPSSPYGSISPYCLKNKQGQNMENIWQFSKVYAEVPAAKERYSRYNKRVIWEHPAETHVKAHVKARDKTTGEQKSAAVLAPEYWEWARKGMAAPDAIRYPVGFHHRHKCIGAVMQGPTAEPVPLLNYVDGRKQIYLPVYCNMLKGKKKFEELRKRHLAGENLLIVEVDGPHRELLPFYNETYDLEALGVAPDFIDEQQTVEMTPQVTQLLLNDTKKPFGHGFCLALAILGVHEDPEWVA